MKRPLLFVLFILSTTRVFAQNADTAEVSISNFKLYPGTYSWRPDAVNNVGGYFDMTSWDSNPYTQGHLKEGSSFRMNYRLLYPLAHNASYEPGYPLIVMLHGGGEKANCWGGSCYHGTTSYSANTEPVNPTVDGLNKLLNNDHNLSHGGLPHLTARNLAAGKLPDDPTLNPRAFPGFVLFPQMMNGWDGQYQHAIRIIRLLVKELNIDPNRIYIHGLSNGGNGVLGALRAAPWLFAAAAPMSAIPSHSEFREKVLNDGLTHIPFWFFQGGQDSNPYPWYTEETIRIMRASGLSVRYKKYANLGHGVWNDAYAEPDFFSWLLSHNKSDITVYYGNPTICGTTGEGAKLGLAGGFPAYQWERDGVIIPGATSFKYIATMPGIYRARFSRVVNPTASQWNIWSKPVTVTEVTPGKASIEVIGSTHLRGPDNINDSTHNSVTLRSVNADDNYYWYRNGALVNIPYNLQDDSVRNFTLMRINSLDNGAYTLRTAGFDNCPTLDSDPVYLFFNNSQVAGISNSAIPTNFTGNALSSSSILLRWTDNTNVERGFEIYRRKFGQPPFDFIKRVPEDAVQFIDTNLEPNTTYEYKIRLINNQGKSAYVPGGLPTLNLNDNLVISTLGDNVAPGAPQNLIAAASGNRKITLNWTPPADPDLDHYLIYFGSDSLQIQAPSSTYTFTGLALNSTFNFTMRAVDQSGKFSQASNQSTANTYVTGLFYKHSTGAWSTLNDLTLQATFASPEFIGVVPNFTLAPRTQSDFFNFEFEGYISIATAGTYRFRTISDDGSRLYIDNVLRINNDGLHGMVTVQSADITLSAGPHEIRVQYFENTGGEGLEVRWQGPDSGTSGNDYPKIPDVKLRSGTPPPAPLPPISPDNLSASPASMTGINLDWDFTGQNPNGLKIVVLGSSTAAGAVGPSSLSKSWVERLRTTLNANTTNLTLTNFGTGGFDTRKVMPTGSPMADATKNITAALALNPNLILVNLPTNDVANNIPLATTMANFRTIKSLADARGVPMFITTSQPRNNLSQPNRDLLDTTADSIRAAFGSYVIDIYDELTDFNNNRTIKGIYDYGDDIHLNDSGHYYIYQQTLNKLMTYLNTFELQRSVALAGPFSTIARTTTTDFNDTGLLSNKEYFYRVRTVNLNGSSPYSAVASIYTFSDNLPPSQPTGLTAPSKTMTSISLIWTASMDNVGVAGYEIWVNGVLIGTSAYPAYMLTNLSPDTPYSVYVRAYDGQGNPSIPSVTLLPPTTTTIASKPYYSRSSGLLTDLSSWTNSPNGIGGTSPTSFVANGNIFNVSNRTSTGLGGNLSVEGTTSKIVVTSGVTLNVDNALNARVEVQGNGVVNLNYAAQTPELLTLSSASTINYNYVNDVVFVQQKSYGNLGLSGAGLKTFQSGVTTVAGNITAGTGVGLKGAFGNLTTINLAGNVTYTGTPGFTASENTVTLNMVKNGVQSITTPDVLDLYQITTGATTTVNVNNNGSASTLRIGSPNGGGLQLNNGSKLNLGGNNLEFIGKAVVNGNNETGQLAVNESQIKITSSSPSSSHLYFDAAARTLSRLEGNLTGAGEIDIESAVRISDGLKIKSGTINSDGNITLLSTLNKTANLEQIENNGEIAGDVTVQRYIHAKGRIYRYISSSVEGVTVADWQTYIPITGPFTGTSTGTGLGTTASLFYYGSNVWVPYPTVDNTAPIERGRGYSVFMRNTTSETLLQTTGVPYQDEIPFQLNPATPGDESSGWNLLGNPYASTVAWTLDNTQWPRSGVSNVLTVRQNNADSLGINQYRYYDAQSGAGNLSGGQIAPGQAFWIKSITANPSLAIRESAKRPAQNFLFREAPSSFSKMTLTLSQGIKSDPAFIVLTPSGTDLLDQEFDGIKRANEGLFNFSSMPENSGVALAINNSSNSFCNKSIRLNLQNVTAGSYTISASDLESFTEVGSVILVDKVLNTTTNLKSGSYSFAITSDPLTYGADRFTLELDRPGLDLTVEASAESICASDARVTLHKTQSSAHYVLLNEFNVPVTEEVIGNGEDVEIGIKKEFLVSGSNRFHVMAGFSGCTSGQLTKDVIVNYGNPLLPQVAPAEACAGTSATLSVTNPLPTATYAWFTPSGTRIKDASGPTLTTDRIAEYSEYEVSMIVNGCEGPRQLAPIQVPVLPVPTVSVERHQLVTSATFGIEWLKDGVPIFNETHQAFRPRSSGVYSVAVSNGKCTVHSEAVTWKVDAEFAVYPNPAKREDVNILFRSPQEGPVRIVITDLLGKILFDAHFDSEKLFDGVRLDIKNRLNPGVYFAQMNQNGTTRKVRFVLE